MASVSPSFPRPPNHAAATGSLPVVRLELRQGTARPVFHDLSELGFLIGTVPGCDLRLPGSELPPVICLIARHAGGASIRKLVPTQPVLVNGRLVTRGPLTHGDRVTLGPLEILVQVQPVAEEETGAAARAAGVILAPVPAPQFETLAGKQRDLEAREAQLARRQDELAAARKEFADIRQQLYDRYRQRRDRLAGLQEAVSRAARKVQEQKRQLDADRESLAACQRQEAARKVEFDAQAAELVRERQLRDDLSRALADRRQEWQREFVRQQADLQAREQKLAQEREAVQKNQAQYQTDLVRLDRLQAGLEQRQQQLQARAREVDQRAEQLQRSSRELEEQARQLDASHDQFRAETRQLAEQREQQEKDGSELAQRAAALEGQQVMLASLRTRLERLREELRREQQQVAERQARLDASEAGVKRQVEEAERLRAQLDGDKQARAQEQCQLEERRSALEAAVAQLRQLQDTLSAKEKQLDERGRAFETISADQAEQARQLQEQASQLVEMQQRLVTDRESLREREKNLTQVEQAREALQEQLRRRSEELAARQRALTEESRKQAEEAAALERRRADLEQERRQAEERLSALRQELNSQAAELERLRGELTEREERLRRHVERLKQAGRTIGGARKSLSEERAQWENTQRQAAEAAARDRAEGDSRRREMIELRQQLPELELRALAASERLAQAREQLREHLAELHAYARQSEEDVEALRAQAQIEAEQVRQQRLALQRARDEHRLAVAAFRQQLIEWQGQVSEMKRSLAHGETRLERRQAQVDEQAREIGATSVRLAIQAEELQQQERAIVERHQEIERHLDDLREWYRRKLRELSAVRSPQPALDRPPQATDFGLRTTDPAILTMTEEVDPGDRKLGDLLRSLDLVDPDTLTALLGEARRHHRSLRQALLAGGYLTLYQMALIESSNLDGLILGPLRVIDRLRVTPREAVYRVFDPRRGQEAVLRHLGEAEMEDAVHPDEFRQRFTQAAAVRHANLAATLEVLEIQDRPAALQEWLAGLPSNDWPALIAVPSIWLRLLGQAALGLHVAHQANLLHGDLQPGRILLTEEGVVKLCGFCEPRWLAAPPLANNREADAAADLADLARIAAGWAAPMLHRKGAKGRRFPEPLQAILNRLRAEDPQTRYPHAAALLEDINQTAADLPPHAEPWERLLLYVRDHGAEERTLRRPA